MRRTKTRCSGGSVIAVETLMNHVARSLNQQRFNLQLNGREWIRGVHSCRVTVHGFGKLPVQCRLAVFSLTTTRIAVVESGGPVPSFVISLLTCRPVTVLPPLVEQRGTGPAIKRRALCIRIVAEQVWQQNGKYEMGCAHHH